MPRAIWKGSITFGLVEIPVGLVSARRRGADLSFDMLDKRDLSPVGYKRVSKSTGREVPWEEIVKGYEYEPDQYVVLGDRDFERANPEAARTVEIMDFVDLASIDPVFFEKPYYLEPLKRNSKGYALLRETLRRTGKAGVARVVIRAREHIAAVYPRGRALAMVLLRYVHELRPAEEIEAPGEDLKHLEVSAQEIRMAERVVQAMAAEWDPGRYNDGYRDDLLSLIDRKVAAGQTRAIEEPEERRPSRARGEVVDLMPLLRRSVEQTRSRSTSSPRKQKRPAGSRKGHRSRSA
ncbi:MAG TPA: Ku protein [Candidatus Polarisedimenticolia bacterium]|nr:Ku protein [Candidatus Polarisedimenticolia bacterium]